MNCRGILVLFLLFCIEISLCYDYQTVLDDWIWQDPILVNYETCRGAVNTLRWDVPQGNSDLYTAMGMNDVMVFRSRDPAGLARSSVIHKSKLWTNGIIPLSVPYGLTIDEKKILACAIRFFHEKTCIRFVPNHYTRPYTDYVSIRKANGGCFSEDMGKKGGQHVVNLHYPYCWDQGTIIHELMHAIGFFHEQSRNDRDKYITVHWDNIPDQGWKYQFLTGKETGVGQQLLGKYDYGSIMHYPRYSYAWGNLPTMSAKLGNVEENNKKMGNREKPTEIDIEKINMLYECSGSRPIKPSKKQETEKRNKEEEEILLGRTGVSQQEENGDEMKSGTWILPIIILTVLVVFNAILGLGIFAYRRRSQLIHRYKCFSYFSQTDLPPPPIAKDQKPQSTNQQSAQQPPLVKIRSQNSSANQRSADAAPQRPQRPRDTIIQGLHEEVGEELWKNRFSWFSKKPKPVPQRKAPPPPDPEHHLNKNGGNLKNKVMGNKKNQNVSRVEEMKKKFENGNENV